MQAVVEAQPVRCPKCDRENEAGAARCRVCWTPLGGAADLPGVRLVALDVPLGALVVFMLKLAVASLPLLLLVGILGATCNAITGGR